MSRRLHVSDDLQLFLPFCLAMMREAFYPYLLIIDDQSDLPPGARRNSPMSTPPYSPKLHSPKMPLDAAQIERWVQTATNKRLALLLCAAEPLYLARAEAFTEMAELLKDVIEELRVVSAALRQESREICRKST